MASKRSQLVAHCKIPRFVRVRQEFPHNGLTEQEIGEILDKAFEDPVFRDRIRPGMRICITCGSRGISNYAFIVKRIVTCLKQMGAEPFLIPAMGSHGSATAEGQREILASFHITEEAMGCPILSSMETVAIGHAEDFNVCIDRNAADADGIIVLNRVKAHTSFQGPYESGLMKMMAIGLGKQYGAHICHLKGDDYMSHRIGLIGNEVIRKKNIIMGVALLENAFDHTYKVAVMPAKDIPEKEPALLREAKEAMGQIKLRDCDILVTEKMGKNYSGSGADPNVVGRCANTKLKMGIDAKAMVVLDISEESQGNATGMQKFDIAPMRFFEKLDMESTYANAITEGYVDGYRMPIIMDNDRVSIQTAMVMCQGIDLERPRIIVIPNSLELEYILVSEAMIPEVERTPGTQIVSELFELKFDDKGAFHFERQ